MTKCASSINQLFSKWAWERPKDLERPSAHEANGFILMRPDEAARTAFYAGYQLSRKWIRVSEQLPQVGKEVLVTIRADHVKGQLPKYQVAVGFYLAADEIQNIGERWYVNGMSRAVYAWMPRPEPYEEEQQ